MRTATSSQHDVVIVGGRVAGAATAMLLARLGHDVVAVDRASFPSDTVSTHSIARSGVLQLRRWGLLDEVPLCHSRCGEASARGGEAPVPRAQ